MDAPDGWRLRPVAQPVSYLDPLSGQWISGSFETAVKSEQRAAVVTSPAAAASSSSSSSAFAAAAQRGSASTPAAHGPWAVETASGPMPTASTAPPLYANAAGGTTVAEDRDAAADGGYHRQFMPTPHADVSPVAACKSVDAVYLRIKRGLDTSAMPSHRRIRRRL